jgi:hypothetical protein
VRVLLDEQLPLDMARMLEGHAATTVAGRGWTGVKNGELLQRMYGEYDALLTMDQGIEFQQNIAVLPFGILLNPGPVKSTGSSPADRSRDPRSPFTTPARPTPPRRPVRHYLAHRDVLQPTLGAPLPRVPSAVSGAGILHRLIWEAPLLGAPSGRIARAGAVHF